MRVRVNGNTKATIYSFDFRTRQDDRTLEKGRASVWLATIKGDGFEGFYYSIDEFIRAIEQLSEKENCCFYCFDLGFHWSYMFYALMIKGYKYAKRIKSTSEKIFTAFGTSHATVVYSATVKATEKGGLCYFKDIKAVYAGFKSLESMALSFKSSRPFHPDDLEKEHPFGSKPTEEERENAISRSSFIFDVLKRQEENAEFFRAITLASFSMKSAIRQSFAWCKNPFAAYRSPKMCPKIEDKDEKMALRCSIKGGLAGPTVAAIDRGYKVDEPLFVIDRTQSYPSEMKLSKLPRGKGQYFAGFEIIPSHIHLYHVNILSFDGVKMHSLPDLMQMHLHFMPEGSEIISLWIWEWEYWQAFGCYINLKMEVLEGYAYKKGVFPFGSYVERNQEERRKLESEGDSIGAAHLKALNVSLYGKLIQKPSTERLNQVEDSEGLLDTESEERDEEKEANYIYEPAGSAIPALSRFHLVQLAEKFGFDNVMYNETDSLIVLLNEHTKAVLDSMELKKELGYWHIEAFAKRAYFPMAKRYKYERDDGETVIKGAGIDVSGFSKDYDEAAIVGTSVAMRQKRRAKGGTLLVKINKKLKEAN